MFFRILLRIPILRKIPRQPEVRNRYFFARQNLCARELCMNGTAKQVVFHLDGQRFGIPIDLVERIIHAVEVNVVPNTTEHVLGVINVEGTIVPVLNVRRLFGLPGRDVTPDEQIVIVSVQNRTAALVVDNVTGLVELSPGEVMERESPVPGAGYVSGISRGDDGIIFLCAMQRLIDHEEIVALGGALV
jgi:purine-binding chemotaxis protein CheW